LRFFNGALRGGLPTGTNQFTMDGDMSKYVLGHDLKGEGTRLALMSQLLDPMHRRYIDALGVVRPGARTLEVGCGNGSISAWLAEHVRPGGKR
jgi:tRNA A58 N-methylase Trm61